MDNPIIATRASSPTQPARSEPATEFPLFMKMPLELREQIYHASVEYCSVVAIRKDNDPESTRDFVHKDQFEHAIKAVSVIPPFLHVHKESRSVICKSLRFSEQLHCPVYLNLDKDIFSFDSFKQMGTFFSGSVLLGCDVENLKKTLLAMAVNYPFSSDLAGFRGSDQAVRPVVQSTHDFVGLKKIYMITKPHVPDGADAMELVRIETDALRLYAGFGRKYTKKYNNFLELQTWEGANMSKLEARGVEWVWVTDNQFRGLQEA